MLKPIVSAVALVAMALPVLSAESGGTVTIPVKEYEALKKAAEADEGKQYWNMTFQQILDKEKGNTAKAWEKYEYYVLRTIYLDGRVDGGSVGRLIEDIRVLSEIDGEKPITLVISSGGGSVFDGLNLYNAMMAAPAPVNTVCDGMAASMAAVLLSAGDERTARAGCVFMIHEVSVGANGGQTTDHIQWTDTVISVENVLLQILSENSGLSFADVRAIGAYDTFYSAGETLALGFVDKVEGDKPRTLTAGSRAVPKGLMPKERMARQLAERMED